jgi:hypothetical protein
VRDPTLAAIAGATIIVAAFAARSIGREGPVQQRAGFQRPTDSLRQHGGAAVDICVANSSSSPTNSSGGGSYVPMVVAVAVLATRQQSKQIQQQQHDNNTTTITATNKTANTEGE